jgi:hypothetical protein
LWRCSLCFYAFLAPDQFEARSARVDDARPLLATHPLGPLDGGTVLSLADRSTPSARRDVGKGVEAFVARRLLADGTGRHGLGAELFVDSESRLLGQRQVSLVVVEGSSTRFGGGRDTGRCLTGVVPPSVAFRTAVTFAFDFGGQAAHLGVTDSATGATKAVGIGRRRRPGESGTALGLTGTGFGNELLLGGTLSDAASLCAVQDLSGRAGTLSVHDRLKARTTLGGRVEPSLTGSTTVGAHSVDDGLSGVGTLASPGFVRVLDLTGRTADGIVSGPS